MGYRKAAPSTEFAPLGDRLLVEPLDTNAEMIGLIVVPDANKPVPQEAEVIAVGPGVERDGTGELLGLGVAPGERVLYGKYSGHTITLNNREYVVLKIDDVLGTLAGAEAQG